MDMRGTEMSETELGQIADKYLWKGELNSFDYLDRMNDQQRWFINMIKKMKKRMEAYNETLRTPRKIQRK